VTTTVGFCIDIWGDEETWVTCWDACWFCGMVRSCSLPSGSRIICWPKMH
jgi:hypothetical protein